LKEIKFFPLFDYILDTKKALLIDCSIMVVHRINIKEYFLPGSIAEAIALLEKGNGKYMPVGGGTSFAFSKPREIEGLVDLSRTGIDYIKEVKDGVHIGAGVTISELIKNPLLSDYYGGVVPEAALCVGNTPLRNVITVGGKVLQIFLWCNLPPLFLAMNAKFIIAGPGKKKRSFRADVFFKKQPRRLIDKTEILKEVILPPRQKGASGAYLRFSKTENDLAMVNVAVILKMEKGICREARVALGAVAPLPVRLFAVEKLLEGKKITKKILKEASEKGTESFKPLKDFRVMDGYKKKILPVLVRRCLMSALDK
jgi:aerobic carbon-monoxide dehydrogenase medium subunit